MEIFFKKTIKKLHPYKGPRYGGTTLVPAIADTWTHLTREHDDSTVFQAIAPVGISVLCVP